MVDSRLAFDIMARDDGATAVLAKVEHALDRTGAAAKKNSKISEDAAKASTSLTKAHNAETTALDKVQVAEARLADVRANSKAKTSQIVAAEKALARARRDAAVAGDVAQKAAKELSSALDAEGKKAGKGLIGALKKSFTLGDTSVFKQLGDNAGNGILGGLTGALKTPVIGPALAAGVLGAVATVLPAAGAAAAGLLVTAFGAGLGTLGVVFAAKSVAVKNSWNRTLSSMGAEMKVLSKPFEATLLSMSGTAKRTFQALTPDLAASFKTLAPAFTSFGAQVGHAFERLGPALLPLSQATAAVLDSLGGALPGMIGKLSNQLIDLSNSVSKNPAGLKDMTSALFSVTDGAVKTIKVLNDLDGALKKIPGGFSIFSGLPAKLSPVKGSFDALFTSISKVDDLLAGSTVDSKQLAGVLGQSGAAASAFGRAAAGAATGLNGQATAAARSAHETHAANAAALLLAGAYDRQAAATQKSIDALNRMSSVLLSLSGAQIAYQQAVDDATAAVKANGKTHDINTQKGRNNKTALDQVAASAIAQRDAMLKANDGNVSAARSATASRASFVKLATQMGYTVPQARAMAQSLIKIPNVTRTAKLQANKADLESKLASAKKQLADPKLTATKKAKLQAEIANLQAGIARAKAALAGVPGSKTVTITTNVVTKYTTVGSRSSSAGIGGGHIAPGRASGGPVTKGVPYIVGEHRPELFVPKESGTIVPKVPSMAMGQNVAAGLAGGIRGGAGSAISAAGDMANAVIAKANQVLGISSPSKKFTQIALYIAQGFNRGIRGSVASVQSAMSSLMSKVVGIGFSSVKQGRILRMLQMENKALQAMVIRRATVATQLKAAQAKLAAAIQIREDFRKQITDAALSYNAITNIAPTDGGSIVGQDIIERMQLTLAKTREFANNLANLKRLGLRSDLYKQIAEAGVEAGGATAAALAQGGKGVIGQVNNLQSKIATASAGLGNTAAANMYQAGVNAAQGLVNGLLAKTKALNAAAAKLANAIVAQVKKTLGIRSPSKVLAWHGSMAGQGFVRGIVGEYGNVRRAGVGLGNAATGMRSRGGSASRGQANSSGGVLRLEIAAGDSGAYSQFLVREFRKYVQINGGNVQQALGTNR